MGSSPHVRGAQRLLELELANLGIIPACAGSTTWLYIEEMESLGSSPHVRGALLALAVSLADRGIIPACAGSTLQK